MPQPEPQELSLNPVAAPTDQFAPKEVRRKLAGTKLIQLGNALRDISPTVGQIADQQYDKWQQGSQMQGVQFAQQHAADATKNQQSFKDAVASGQVHMADNPWFMVGAKQTIARQEAIGQMAQAKNDLFKDPIAHQDDPSKVDAFLRSRIQTMSQGRDAWEVAAMHNEADASRQRILSEWTDQRRQERVSEAHSSSTTLIRQRIDQWGPELAKALQGHDPDAQKQFDGMVGSTQAELQNLGSVVDWPTANQWVSEAVLQAARDHRDYDLARRVLDGLKGKDGQALSNTADNKAALTRLPREIEQLRNMDLETEVRNRQLQATKEAQEMVTQADQWKKEQGVSNLFDVKVPLSELGKHSPLAMEEFQKMQAGAAEEYKAIKDSQYHEQLDPLVADAFKKASSGNLTDGEFATLGAAMSLLGDPGRTALEGLERFMGHQRGLQEGNTTVESLATLNKAYTSGTLNPDLVLKMRQDKTLSHSDSEKWLTVANQIQAEGGKGSPVVQESEKQIENLLSAPFLSGGVKLPGDHETLVSQIEQAKAAFKQAYYGKLVKSDGWEDLSYSEQHKQIEDLRDSIVKSTNAQAPTMADWLKQYQQAKQSPKPLNTVPPTTEPSGSGKAQQQAGDPLALKSTTVSTLGKMMQTDVEKLPIHQMLQWSQGNTDPLGPSLHSGQDALNLVHEERSKLSFLSDAEPEPVKDKQGNMVRKPSPWADVNIDKGTVGNSRTAFLRMQTEAKSWQSAMQKLQALKPVAEQAQGRLEQIAESFQKTGQTTFEQQQEVKQLTLQYLAFQDLRTHLGYTPEEVKDLGPGAWRQAPMFANPLDLQQRGEEIAKKLGVREDQQAAFAAAQLNLMKQLRSNGDQQQ